MSEKFRLHVRLAGLYKVHSKCRGFYKTELLELADFYDDEWMPHITYYDDINNLRALIGSKDLADISNNMEKFNQKRRERIYSLWEDTINAG